MKAGKPDSDGLRFIKAALLSNLTGDASDVGMHTLCIDGERVKLDGERVKLLGDDSQNVFDGKLFVRDAGVQLRQYIFEEHAKSGQLCFVATGTPGIGKSSFDAYFAAMFLREAKRVLFQLKNSYGVLLEPGVACQPPKATRYRSPSTNIAWLELLDSQDGGWYIVDSSPPLFSKLPTLLVTSTQPTMYKEWLKQAGARQPYFMPIPTKDAVFTLRDALQLSITDEELNRHYELFGGSFRLCFSGTPFDELKDRVDRVIATTDLLDAQRDMEGAVDDKALRSLIIHADVECVHLGDGTMTWEFSRPFYFFSSPYVRAKVVARAWRDSLPTKWLSVQSDRAGWSRERVCLFEGLGMRCLVAPLMRAAVTRWDANGSPCQDPHFVCSPFEGCVASFRISRATRFPRSPASPLVRMSSSNP
jgi:hypothetical protein